MKILHISTSDRGGGAAIGAYRLVEAMRMGGIDAQMLVLHKQSDSTFVIPISNYKRKWYKYYEPFIPLIGNFVRKLFLNYNTDFSCGVSCTKGILKIPVIKEADVIYIHWAQAGFININTISRLASLGKPIFLYCHDMWYFTGGCNCAMDCNGWLDSCSCCSVIQRNFMKNYPKMVLNKKKNKWGKDNIGVIAPSHWIESCLRKSIVFKEARIYRIPNTVNSNVFCVLNKVVCRKILGLPLNRKLVLFGAVAGTANPYKGWKYAKEAMLQLSNEADLVVFGNQVLDLPITAHSIGRLNDEYSLALLYNAVDVYISPTLAESFGQTIMESISCGTKAVAFNVGGVPDIIDHKNTGYLAELKDVDDLIEGIRWSFYTNNEDVERIRIHNIMKERFSYPIVTELHRNAIRIALHLGGGQN